MRCASFGCALWLAVDVGDTIFLPLFLYEYHWLHVSRSFIARCGEGEGGMVVVTRVASNLGRRRRRLEAHDTSSRPEAAAVTRAAGRARTGNDARAPARASGPAGRREGVRGRADPGTAAGHRSPCHQLERQPRADSARPCARGGCNAPRRQTVSARARIPGPGWSSHPHHMAATGRRPGPEVLGAQLSTARRPGRSAPGRVASGVTAGYRPAERRRSPPLRRSPPADRRLVQPLQSGPDGRQRNPASPGVLTVLGCQ